MSTKETTEARACAALLRRKVDRADMATVDHFIGLSNIASRNDALAQIETVEAAMGKVADLLESMAGKLEAIKKCVDDLDSLQLTAHTMVAVGCARSRINTILEAP